MTDERLTEEELQAYEASDRFDVRRLAVEVRRLRALIRDVVAGQETPWCPLCSGQESHVEGCRWAKLQDEAKP
jgi:hypothetical protein